MTNLIFMLTHHDVTIPNALDVLEEVKATKLRFIGCKDIGLPMDKLIILFGKMKKAGMTTFLEVVSASEEQHFSGVDKAVKVGADFLIGGMPAFTARTVKYLNDKKNRPKFFPYIGRVKDHPCILEGTVEQIIENGKESEKKGIDGINLLLYRYTGNIHVLFERAVQELSVPLIVAGSIDNFEKMDQQRKKGIWAFTIGGAIFEKKFAPEKGIKEQVEAVLKYL